MEKKLTKGKLEVILVDTNGKSVEWWYDLRTKTNSIAPDAMLESYPKAIAHAKRAAKRFGIEIVEVCVNDELYGVR